MNDVERSLAQIADIRAQFAASTRFLGIAPGANVVFSALSLAVAIGQTVWPQWLACDPVRYILVWGGVLISSTIVVAFEAISRCRYLHGRMASAMLAAAWGRFCPFISVAVIMTVLICWLSPDSVWIVPGLWLMLIALQGFSALTCLPPLIFWVATWYFSSGTVVLAAAGWSRVLSPWMMGIPLTVGFAAVAIAVHFHKGAPDERL